MSKAPFKKSFYPPEKNVFVINTIPDSFKDQIRSIVNSGDYGKLEELLINYPVSLNFVESDLKISLLHNVIQSQLTNIQKEKLVELLINRGMSINITDENNLTPLYHAIKLQLPNIVKILVEKTHNLNRSPKNFDYFRLALEPSIGQCKSQLFNVQDQAMMSKYYSQQINIEREFKTKMNSLPITAEIIKYIVNFIQELPTQKLEYFNLDEFNEAIVKRDTIRARIAASRAAAIAAGDPTGDAAAALVIARTGNPDVNSVDYIKNTYIVVESDEQLGKLIPKYENKFYYALEDITKDIQQSLTKGEINEEQILAKKSDLIKKIKSVLDTQLDSRSLNNIPILRSDFIYDPVDLANADKEILYKKFIQRGIYSPINLFNVLFIKYQRIQSNIIETLQEIPQLIEELSNINNLIGNAPQIDLTRLLRDINRYIDANHLDNFLFPNNFDDINSNLDIIKKFHDTIIYVNFAYIRIIENLYFSRLIDIDFIDELVNPDKRRQEPIIDNLRNFYDNNEIFKNYKILNQFIIEVNNITESGLLYNKFINSEKLLFDKKFILTKYDLPDPPALGAGYAAPPPVVAGDPLPPLTPYLQKIGFYTKNFPINYYNIPNTRGLDFRYYYIDNPILFRNIRKSTDPNDFPKPENPGNIMMYIPESNEIINLKVLASIYHEKVFKEFLNNINGADLNQIRDTFQAKNPDINIDQINKLLLTTLDSAIKNNFKELVNLSLLVTSGTLVNNKLLNVAAIPGNHIDFNKIQKIITKKLDIININRNDRDQIFYLDENYTSSEPIDNISCLNNNQKILELLKKKMHIDPKEYQVLIFKLGNSNILRELNTRNKITKIDLADYLDKHKQKFLDSIQFLNNQLDQEIKLKQLDFIVNNNNNYIINDNEFNDIRIPNIGILQFDDIYDDLINKQEYSNLYLYNSIKIKLNILFSGVIFPQITNFLQLFSDNALGNIINYVNLLEDLKPIIDNIIYYHIGIDPTKSKENNVPLETSVNQFSELFINLLEESSKIKITGIYNERLKTKIIDLLSILCKYYGCVYRNFLKYVFNDVRYRKLDQFLE